METKTKLLIAVGAAVVANCQPCLKTLLKKAKENAVEEKEILEAISVARVVRKKLNHTNRQIFGGHSWSRGSKRRFWRRMRLPLTALK